MYIELFSTDIDTLLIEITVKKGTLIIVSELKFGFWLIR